MLTIYLSMLDTQEDKDKLTRIYEKYYGAMLSVAKNIIYDNAMAEDAVSESILTIIENIHKISDVSCHKTRAYIVIIVRSRALNLLNKQKRHPEESINDFELQGETVSVLDMLTMKESYDKIVDNIKTLPKSLSDVLYLSVVMEHSNKEISDLLEISNDAVRQRLSRAKAQLKTKLTQEEFEYAGK